MWSALFGPEDDNRPSDVLYGAGEEPDAMTMLLGRLTTLLERLGEADHARKQWEDKAKKLESTNRQLTHELEMSTDAQLRERIDDLTAMNSALNSVKVTLEKEVDAKETRVVEQENVVKTLEAKVEQLDADHKERLAQLEQLNAAKEDTEKEIQRLCRSFEMKVAEITELSKTLEAARAEHGEAQAVMQSTFEGQMNELSEQHEQVHAQDQAQLQETMNNVAHLQNCIAELEGQLAAQAHLEFELRQHVAKVQNDCELANEELCAEKARLTDALAKIHRLEMDHAAIKQLQSSWKEDAIRKLTEQVKIAQDELTRMMELNCELSERNLALEEELEGPNPALEHAQAHIQTLEDEIDEWRVNAESSKEIWTDTINKERETVAVQAARIEQLEASISELEESVNLVNNASESQLYALQAELDNLRYEMSTKTEEWASVHQELTAQLTERAGALQSQTAVHSAQVETLEETIKSIHAAKDKEVLAIHATLVKDKEELMAQLASAQENAANSTVNAQLEEENAKLLKSVNDHQSAQESWQAEKISLDETIAALQQELASTVAQRNELSAQLEALENIPSLEAANSDLSQKLSSYESINAELESEVSTLKASCADYEAQLNVLQQQIQNTQEFVGECEENALEWERKYDEVYNELDNLSATTSELRSIIETLEADKSNLESSLSSLQSELDAKQSLMDQQATQLHSESTNASEKIAQMMQDHQATLKHLHDDYKNQLAQAHSTIETLRSDVSAANAAKEVEEEFNKYKEHAQAEISSLQQELFAAHERIEELRASVQQEKQVSANLTTEHEAEKARLVALLDQGKQAFSVLKNKHTQMLDDFRKESEEKAALALVWQKKLNDATAKLSSEKAAIEADLAASKKMLSDVHASAELSNERLEEHIRELQHQMHLRENKFESETEDLLEEIANLNGQLTDIQVQNNVLSARSHRLARDLSQFMDLPPEDAVLIANPNTPNLWELLANGMEQLKSDLEVASTYASNLDQMENFDNVQDANFSTFSPSNVSAQDYIDREPAIAAT
ncbi:hypothetical protein THRCLA_00946 [Thraustotheca clavata]|uniref:Uncharacterized protein n=1 Tax=Thraustotheca clavata TaxID=74557 RepID=A0A1W0A9Y1_9STRA|nr:hypothetical protein THRCLA_00946 [Thraustotheca clavata]